MYLIGVILVGLSAFFSISLSRNFIKGLGCRLSDRVLDVISIIFLCAGLSITTINHLYDQREKNKLKEQVSALRDYAEVARWDFRGDRSLGGGAKVPSPIAGWAEAYIVEHGDDRVVWKCNPHALECYRRMTIKHPRYPFAYYFLAKCLRELREDAWRDYAEEGICILEKTTKIPGHDPGHDDALRELRALLEK